MKPISRLRIAASERSEVIVDRRAVDLHVAFRRHVEQAHQVEQRALAAARRPHDRDELAFAHVEVDVGQRDGFDPVRAIHLLDALQSDHDVVPRSSVSSRSFEADLCQVQVVAHVRDDHLVAFDEAVDDFVVVEADQAQRDRRAHRAIAADHERVAEAVTLAERALAQAQRARTAVGDDEHVDAQVRAAAACATCRRA